jgi:hypothetical protein
VSHAATANSGYASRRATLMREGYAFNHPYANACSIYPPDRSSARYTPRPAPAVNAPSLSSSHRTHTPPESASSCSSNSTTPRCATPITFRSIGSSLASTSQSSLNSQWWNDENDDDASDVDHFLDIESVEDDFFYYTARSSFTSFLTMS